MESLIEAEVYVGRADDPPNPRAPYGIYHFYGEAGPERAATIIPDVTLEFLRGYIAGTVLFRKTHVILHNGVVGIRAKELLVSPLAPLRKSTLDDLLSDDRIRTTHHLFAESPP